MVFFVFFDQWVFGDFSSKNFKMFFKYQIFL
jgi:hypothetical protein